MYSLEELWKESSGEVNPKTFRELVRLGDRIDKEKKKRAVVRNVLAAAAVAASLAVVAVVTFSLSRNKYQVAPLDCTANLVAEYGKTASVTLPDGTLVHLNSGSTLLYPETFEAGSRIVFLSGEGNFTVAKDEEHPFIVKTAYMDVQALGTTFNVKSFIGDKSMRTTLAEGRVKVSFPSFSGKDYILDPNSQLVFNPSERTVSVIGVNADKVLGWEEGYLSFINAPFSEVASALERKYDVSIRYNSEKLKGSALNVRFLPDESLDDALKVLKLLIPGSRYTRDGARIYWQF